jgi:thioredoxin-related protein
MSVIDFVTVNSGSRKVCKMSTGTWISVTKAKAQALSTKTLILVDIVSSNCNYCSTVETQIFKTKAWKDYAKAKGLSQCKVNSSLKTDTAQWTRLQSDYGITSFPTLLLFSIKDTADISSPGLDQNNVEVLGKFVYRKNGTMNKIKMTNTPANFIQILESFYPASPISDTDIQVPTSDPVTGTWTKTVSAAKIKAHNNSGLLLVMSGNSSTCHYCSVTKTEVFDTQAWKDYARIKAIPQYYADAASSASRPICGALSSEYRVVSWPTILIFRLKSTADLSTNSLDQLTTVDLVGKFLYRQTRPSPANFIKLLESFKI